MSDVIVYVLYALIATSCTWLMTALGALTVIFFNSENHRLMNLMLGFAAGVMIAASFWSLLEPAVVRAEADGSPAWLVASAGFICGAVFLWASDRIVSFARNRVRSRMPETKKSRTMLLVMSVTLHNIPEGLAVGVAFGALSESSDPQAVMGAAVIALGIGVQNFPEGAAVSLPLRREGVSKLKSFMIGQASAIVEPIAGVIGAAAVVYVEAILPFALAFAAGAMILVAVHELIPECQRTESADSYSATFGIVAGFTVMMLLDVALG